MVVVLSELPRDNKTFLAPVSGERSFASSSKLLRIVDALEIKDAVMHPFK